MLVLQSHCDDELKVGPGGISRTMPHNGLIGEIRVDLRLELTQTTELGQKSGLAALGTGYVS